MNTLKGALKWLKKEARGRSWKSKAKRVGLAATVYYIWRARNEKIFEETMRSQDELIHLIKIHVYKVLSHRFSLHFNAAPQLQDGLINENLPMEAL